MHASCTFGETILSYRSRTLGKASGEGEKASFYLPNGQGFLHGIAWTVGIKMAEQVPQADLGSTRERCTVLLR